MAMTLVSKVSRSFPRTIVSSVTESLSNLSLNHPSHNMQTMFYQTLKHKQQKTVKHRKGRIEGVRDGGNDICFGKYALQALEPARITSKQLEAGRRALQLNVKRGGKGGKVWVRVFPYKSVTKKPAETRMGKGKGAIAYYVAPVQSGQIIYEMGGISEALAKRAIQIAGSKMPIQTRSIILDPQRKEIGIK